MLHKSFINRKLYHEICNEIILFADSSCHKVSFTEGWSWTDSLQSWSAGFSCCSQEKVIMITCASSFVIQHPLILLFGFMPSHN